jgi:cytochrome c peroxidase
MTIMPCFTVLQVIAAAMIACAAIFDEEAGSDYDPRIRTLPNSVPAPKDNPTTLAKVQLGKQLFFDPRLSGDNQMSCATCHIPEKAFGDGLVRSKGADGRPLARNTPTLLNVGFYSAFFWDGRAESLEQQALGPIQSAEEMHQDLGELVQELRSVPGYASQFQEVFGRPTNQDDIARALAAFERTLVTRNSPFDRYLAGENRALSPRAREGLELFRGEAGCIRCHNGPLLSDGKYYRLGVGRGDRGRGAVTEKLDDLYKFRTPSLRNVADTGPYMHDGSHATLFEVVQFYYRGVPSRGPDDLDLDVEPLLDRSYSEIGAIVEFLESLSGELSEKVPPKRP